MIFTFITGGVRSGKSVFAEQMAASRSQFVLYTAFGVATDVEMKQRIEIHQKRRPKMWGVWEGTSSLHIPTHMLDTYDLILVDCLSTWVANRCMQIPEAELRDSIHKENIRKEAMEWLETVRNGRKHIIVVSSEVGLGGVAMSPLGRLFQDVLGDVNQLTARYADEVYTVLSGIPVRIKG